MDITTMLEQFGQFQNNVVLQQLVIVSGYMILAKIADIIITRILMRIARRTRWEIDDTLIALLHWPILLTIFSLGILHALVLKEIPPPWQNVLPALTKSTIIVVWMIACIRTINILANQSVDRIVSRGKIGNDFFILTKNLVRILVFVLALFWLFSLWEVNLAPFFASAGVAGIAVALAAKDTLANFFGGISIFLDKTFKVGDYIIIDSGERGEVVEVGIRSTRIKTRDDVLITIPNSLMANSKIINESAPEPRFRIRVPVGVAYGTDLAEVERVLLSVAHASPSVVPEPKPRVRVRGFNASSVDFELLLWVEDPSVKGLETHNLLNAIYLAFQQSGITIPFPQLDVHLNQLRVE
ncbi:mechanosensitive ion channel family protein [Thermodesulfobacteriota bacterium]